MYNQETTTDSQNQQGYGHKGRGCGGSFGKKFGGRFGDAFGEKAPWGKMFGGQLGNRKAANIEENDSAFIISLYAAGLKKSNFKIAVNNDVLTISHSIPQSEDQKTRYIHQEYEPGAFERSFQLNGKVLAQNISAEYTDGVLKVTMPKNPESNKPAQEVNVN